MKKIKRKRALSLITIISKFQNKKTRIYIGKEFDNSIVVYVYKTKISGYPISAYMKSDPIKFWQPWLNINYNQVIELLMSDKIARNWFFIEAEKYIRFNGKKLKEYLIPGTLILKNKDEWW